MWAIRVSDPCSPPLSTLVDEPYTPEHMSFLKEMGIAHIRILVEPNKDPAVKSPDYVICQVLEVLLNKANHPVLVHCNKGKVRLIQGVIRAWLIEIAAASDRLCGRLLPQDSRLAH